jgi:hypothetical protein
MRYSNPCRSRKSFYPTPTLPLVRGGSKKFTNDLGLLYEEKLWVNQQPTSGIVTINKFDEEIFFMSSTTREQLHQQIDSLPDHIVEQIASLILSITTQQKIPVSEYRDWQSTQWQDFALMQLFGEDDEIEYSLDDAQEIYQPLIDWLQNCL